MAPNAAVAVVTCLALAGACGNGTERERVDFERMRVQQKAELYGASGVFANHQAMQLPPEGTVTHDDPADTGAFATGITAGRAVTAIPSPVTSAGLALGAAKFRIYCAVCHGPSGYGGSTVAENMGPPRPPSLHSARLLAAPAGYIYTVASHGIGRMPSYAEQLSPAERWDVVAYIQQLQRTPAATAEAIDDSLRAIGIQRADSLAKARGKR